MITLKPLSHASSNAESLAGGKFGTSELTPSGTRNQLPLFMSPRAGIGGSSVFNAYKPKVLGFMLMNGLRSGVDDSLRAYKRRPAEPPKRVHATVNLMGHCESFIRSGASVALANEYASVKHCEASNAPGESTDMENPVESGA